jgi:hypothetical protein
MFRRGLPVHKPCPIALLALPGVTTSSAQYARNEDHPKRSSDHSTLVTELVKTGLVLDLGRQRQLVPSLHSLLLVLSQTLRAIYKYWEKSRLFASSKPLSFVEARCNI